MSTESNSPSNLEREKVIKKAELLAQRDTDFKTLFESEALDFLRKSDPRFFNKRYNGERDADGYLLDREGRPTNMLPSQNITHGIDKVSAAALSKFRQLGRDIDAILKA